MGEQHTSLAGEALTKAAERVTHAPNGKRHFTLLLEAAKLTALINQGICTRTEVEDVLAKAAEQNGLTPDETRRMLSAAPRTKTEQRHESVVEVPPTPITTAPSQGDRPKILITGRQTRDVVDESVSHLKKLVAVYNHLGQLVTVNSNESIEPLSPDSLTSLMLDELDIEALAKDGRAKPTNPNAHVAKFMLSKRVEQFQPLHAILRQPTFLPDGTLLSKPGYDEATGYFVSNQTPITLESMSVEESIGIFRFMLWEFPFVHPDASLSAFLAALITILAMPVIKGPIPMLVIEAPSQGHGKSLLPQLLGIITEGIETPTAGVDERDTDLSKALLSALLEAKSVYLLDDLDSKALNRKAFKRLLTSRSHSDRLLGQSKWVTVANNALFVATGNDILLDDELFRRVFAIAIDSGLTDAENRTGFLIDDLKSWCLKNRPLLLSALIAIIQNWFDQDCPEPPADLHLGSFESFVDVVGGILNAAQLPGFLEGREHLREKDPRYRPLLTLLKHMHRELGSKQLVVADFEECAKRHALLNELVPGLNPQADVRKRLGRLLIRYRDKQLGAFVLAHVGKDPSTQNHAYRIWSRGDES